MRKISHEFKNHILYEIMNINSSCIRNNHMKISFGAHVVFPNINLNDDWGERIWVRKLRWLTTESKVTH